MFPIRWKINCENPKPLLVDCRSREQGGDNVRVIEAWDKRIATMACGCHRKIGGGKRAWERLWCEVHKWQKVTKIELDRS